MHFISSTFKHCGVICPMTYWHITCAGISYLVEILLPKLFSPLYCIVPWCLLQLGNRIHVVHSSTIRYTLLLYITPCLSSGRAAEHSPLSVTCYHLNSQNCLVYEHMSPFCKIQFLSIVPWCLLQLSNRIHVVHSSTI